MELFKLFGTIAINGIDAASSGLEKISGKAETVGKKMKAAGDKITGIGKVFAPVTAAIGGIAAASVKSSMSFEDAMAKVSTIADTTQVPLSDLQSSIMDLSNQTGISSSEIADNVYNAISAGQETGDAVNFVSKATQLAKAGFAETGDALDILSTIMNAYGMEADQVTNVSDMLIQTQNKGKTTVAELSSAMGKVIPTANAFGVGLDQVCSSYAIMTANGIATAESTTYLNGMLNELGKSGTTVSDIIKKKTGKSFSELMEGGSSLGDVLEILQNYADKTGKSMSDLWSSSEAGKAALTLVKDGASGFNDVLDGMKDSVGSTEEAFGKLQTNSFSIKKSLNELKNTGIELGSTIMEVVAPYISLASEKVHELSEWFKGLDEDEKRQIVKIGALVAAISPALLITGKVISTIGFLTGTIGSLIGIGGKVISGIGTVISIGGKLIGVIAGLNPVTIAIVAAIAGVIAIGVLLYKNWDTIKEKAAEIKEKVCEAFSSMATILSTIGSRIVSVVSEKFKDVTTAISSKLSGAKQVVQSAFENIRSSISDKMNGAKNVASSALDGVRSAFGKFSSVKSSVSSTFDSIRSKIGSAMDTARNTVQNSIDRIKSAFHFSWSLPKLKLPHIKISGGFSINPPSAPHFSIDWYKKAMDNPLLMTRPTAFGINNLGQIMAGGEAGAEIVAGADTIKSMISDAVESRNVELINILQMILNAILSMDDALIEKMRRALESMSFQINNREFARLVRMVK